ncbi:MAG: AraC family transcriptional regulator [Paracoccaceae bacterium]
MTELDDLSREVRRRAAAGTGYSLPLVPDAGLVASRMIAPTRLEKTIYTPFYCLVLAGRKKVHLGERAIDFTPGEGVIVSHHLPVLARVEEASLARPYLALAMELDIDLLRSLAEGTANGAEAAEPISAGRATPGLVGAFGRLAALTDDAGARAVLAPLLRTEIHFHLLRSGHGAMLRRLTRVDSHASRIARAIAEIRRGFAGPLRVADLAAAAGMSASSFHEHFRAVTATTPIGFQKDLRLAEARRLLASGSHSVGTVAHMVGYESPTQFSREYARAFGQPPRNDLRGAA